MRWARSPLPLTLALLIAPACASHREGPLPTLEDYSEGVSTFAEDFLNDWKEASASLRLYGPGFQWHGPLPGDRLTNVSSRPPLQLGIYRQSGPDSGPSTGA